MAYVEYIYNEFKEIQDRISKYLVNITDNKYNQKEFQDQNNHILQKIWKGNIINKGGIYLSYKTNYILKRY